MIGTLLLLAGCSAYRVEQGVFHSSKGYRVTLPGEGWRVEPDGRADLTLARVAAPGAMLADATCDGRAAGRPLRLLSRHLVFGLVHRTVVDESRVELAGRAGVRTVTRGQRDGVDVEVEAVVVKDERCVYDFLYVAPVAAFPDGQPAFRAFVGSFGVREP